MSDSQMRWHREQLDDWWTQIHHHLDNPSTPSGIPHDPPLLPDCTHDIWEVLMYMDYKTFLRARDLIEALEASTISSRGKFNPEDCSCEHIHASSTTCRSAEPSQGAVKESERVWPAVKHA